MAKTSSKHQQTLYALYKSENRFATNRKRKLLKQLKQHPNNEQIAVALNNIKYRRKAPKTSQFSKTKIAQLSLANKVKRNMVVITKPIEKYMFKLGTRAHDSTGKEFSWNF